jgi:hypothetical protein
MDNHRSIGVERDLQRGIARPRPAVTHRDATTHVARLGSVVPGGLNRCFKRLLRFYSAIVSTGKRRFTFLDQILEPEI